MIEARAGAIAVRPTLSPFIPFTQSKMPRLSIATPLRSLRAAAARPTAAATRFAAPAVSKTFHLSARSTAPAAADAVKSAGAPALSTTGQPITDPTTGEVTKNADIDVSSRVCPFRRTHRSGGGRRPAARAQLWAADGAAEGLMWEWGWRNESGVQAWKEILTQGRQVGQSKPAFGNKGRNRSSRPNTERNE